MNAVIGKPKRSHTKEGNKIRRCRQLQRVLTVAYVIRREDHLTVSEIHQRLRAHFCIEVCERTVQRDLDALLELGIADTSICFEVDARVYHFVSCKIFESGVISGM